MENENLRWMVFKVKQKSQTTYSDLITPQVGQSTGTQFSKDTTESSYKIAYNWPYDYLSFVELIKIEAEVLYREPVSESPITTPVTTLTQDDMNADTESNIQGTQVASLALSGDSQVGQGTTTTPGGSAITTPGGSATTTPGSSLKVGKY
jgi:hypothetical protein